MKAAKPNSPETQSPNLEPSNPRPSTDKKVYVCDRCGSEMREKNCKVTCPNCGNRFDCSDLNIYFD
jgi:rubrerythrin